MLELSPLTYLCLPDKKKHFLDTCDETIVLPFLNLNLNLDTFQTVETTELTTLL